ncbi:MAG: lytic transglycosylase domain-containing protein [bacterium]
MIFKTLWHTGIIYIFILMVISCPHPAPKEISIASIAEYELIAEAQRCAEAKPLYACNLLKKVTSPQYRAEKTKTFLKIYFDQRAYSRASIFLDSIGAEFDFEKDKTIKELACAIYLKQKNWEKVFCLTEDSLLKGVALYNLQRYHEAIEYLSHSGELSDYRLLLLARCYYKLNDIENALKTILDIDSISPYLTPNYQNLLLDLLLSSAEISIIKKEMQRLKDPVIKKFLQLKIYERQNDRKNLRILAFDLIKNNPSTPSAKYCINIVRPKTAFEYKLFGKVAYLHKDYDQAMKFLKKASKDEDVYYYLGKINYDQQVYNTALKYFSKSHRQEAYYYRGLIYENRQNYSSAINVYDSLSNKYKYSKYAKRALKRKAFLLEDIGDTLGAIENFVKVKEKSADFRAGLQLFRIGQLNRALEIISNYSDPDFIYWQIKIRERLGEPIDSLREYLFRNYPLSYYTLVRSKGDINIDTISLDNWLKQFGDTLTTFDHIDSLHIHKAIRYFNLDENNYALAELELIEDKSFTDLIYLSKLCSAYGYDYGAIKFSLQLKKRYENNTDSRNYPVEFLKLIYPAKYIFDIIENTDDVWLIFAMIWQESMFDPNATSKANAQGLMQIIPKTGELLARNFGITSYSLYDPEISIKFGVSYFSNLMNEFNSPLLALAAYNAGPINLRRWLKKNPNAEIDEFIELIPYVETRDYVRLTITRQMIYKKIWRTVTEIN